MKRLDALRSDLKFSSPALEVRVDEPMAKHTSFRIGGPARLMALPKSETQAVEAIEAAARYGIRPIFIGNGSNLLVSDAGVDAFIIKIGDAMNRMEVQEGGVLRFGAGTLLSRAARFALENGLSGMEFAHGIPGCVGGAVTMNAGAYGGEMSGIVEKVGCVRLDGRLDVFSRDELDFSYRKSRFQNGDCLILSTVVRLTPGEPVQIKARMEELMERRRSKQPLEYPSAGSTFKRPENGFAAALIEECGLKGYRVGAAQVSTKHSGFVVNLGGATCEEVLRVISHVYETVLAQTGIRLEPEVKLLGV